MRSDRIVLEYTDNAHGWPENPHEWDWHSLLNISRRPGTNEAVSVEEIIEIPTPEAHKEDLADEAP